MRGAARDLVAQPFDRTQPELDADPHEHERHVELREVPQQRADEAVARRRLGSRAHVRHGEDQDSGGGVEPFGERAQHATPDLGHGERRIGAWGDRGDLAGAQQQRPIGAAQRVFNGIGSGHRRLAARAGVETHRAAIDLDPRRQRGRRVPQPLIAADDTGSDAVEVVYQRAAERQQHEGHCQPENQLAADGRGHADFASSRR